MAVATVVRDGYRTKVRWTPSRRVRRPPVRPQQHLILTARPELYPPGIVAVGIDDPRLGP